MEIRFPTRKLNAKQTKDISLINEVKKFKFLYDTSMMDHKRTGKRKSAWDEIGRIMGAEGIDCMNRWKMLRDRYRKEKRSLLRAVPKKKRWLYCDILSFLDPYLEDNKPMNVEDEYEELQVQVSQFSADESPEEDDSPTSAEDSSLPYIHPLVNNSLDQESKNDSMPLQLIRIISPTVNTSKAQNFPRKYVKILPKSNKPNGNAQEKAPSLVEDIRTYSKDNLSNNSTGSPTSKKSKQEDNPAKLDTVDHLMAFMGNTIKQLSPRKQIKICQDLTSAFFDIVSKDSDDEL